MICLSLNVTQKDYKKLIKLAACKYICFEGAYNGRDTETDTYL